MYLPLVANEKWIYTAEMQQVHFRKQEQSGIYCHSNNIFLTLIHSLLEYVMQEP